TITMEDYYGPPNQDPASRAGKDEVLLRQFSGRPGRSSPNQEGGGTRMARRRPEHFSAASQKPHKNHPQAAGPVNLTRMPPGVWTSRLSPEAPTARCPPVEAGEKLNA